MILELIFVQESFVTLYEIYKNNNFSPAYTSCLQV